MSARNLVILLAASLVCYACYIRAEQNPYARYVAAGFSAIDELSLTEVPDQELFNSAMNGMIDVLHKHGDEHSQFVDAEVSEAYREEFSQEFGGIGVRLRVIGDPPLPTVIGPPEPGSPAAKADVRLADRIAAVDGHSTKGLNVEQVTALVRGPIGESVTLTLDRPGEPKPVDAPVERAVIMVESIIGDLRDDQGRWNYPLSTDPRIGYLRLTKFGDKSADELARILNELAVKKLTGESRSKNTDQPIEALILDVRDDGGGALDAAVDVCDLFLKAGLPIVTTRERDGTIRDRYVSTGAGAYHDLPLVVLVDRNSASASEIVAACLQDYRRAAIAGERSFGKGTVQRLLRIESGRSLLKLTTATYWRPSGKNIHRMPGDGEAGEWGVKPDPELAVTLTDDQYDAWQRGRLLRDLIGEGKDEELARQVAKDNGEPLGEFADPMLDRAVEHLQAKLAP